MLADCLCVAKALTVYSLRHYKYYDKCQALCYDSTYWALPIHTTFSDFDYIWRSQQCQTVLTEDFMFFIQLSWTLYSCWLRQVHREYTTILYFRTCSRKIIDIYIYISSFEKKNFNIGFFSDTLNQDLSNFAWLWLGVYIVILGFMILILF